ncbi:hypothetical protein, partial [Duncaniella muris]|uniref:hypothetical protein n=1 Tax=Duncaniella muris TaxID=2094150 RepID=UPI0025A66355
VEEPFAHLGCSIFKYRLTPKGEVFENRQYVHTLSFFIMNDLAIHLYLIIRYINLSFNYFCNFYRIIAD